MTTAGLILIHEREVSHSREDTVRREKNGTTERGTTEKQEAAESDV